MNYEKCQNFSLYSKILYMYLYELSVYKSVCTIHSLRMSISQSVL